MNFGTLLSFIALAGFYFFSQHFKFKNNLVKIGTQVHDFKFPNFKKKNLYWFAIFMFSGFIAFEYLLSKLDDFNYLNSFLKLCFFGVIFSRSAYNRIIIGEKGFYFYDKLFLWKNISSIKWDSDIGQTQWGLKIYSKDTKVPAKLYFERDAKVLLEPIFNQQNEINIQN
jgi:hypothetical protein